jgi:hypothetical protein
LEEAAAKLAAFETELRGWVAGKISLYEEDGEVRRKQDAKHGDRAGYEASLEKIQQEKMASARSKAALDDGGAEEAERPSMFFGETLIAVPRVPAAARVPALDINRARCG